ncbi:hypothetical protein HBH92_100060 [Parastagonospora nodorum]|nr:hypothetical protein HBH52_005540 [Parastagonospora nodorum]KAH4006678.1 hypothetical protein HBI10_016430 [Parastagonospora nodorum]KAH4025827.1 hypothetical protein HBI13_070360 [Parastagonospora nodorum]KAH4101395.1 hypothetical protein HBH46_138920 [Parastagonospora nodorum]KAH4412783.1 hypothetical protein HBH92_100060 [Parastagonospora nodorum]
MHISRLTIGIAVGLVLLLLYTITSISAVDPTSIYFRASTGYAPRYSAFRREQAEAYVAAFDHAPNDFYHASNDEKRRKLCVGIPSIKRDVGSYLPATVGSLLEGLTREEREEIYLIVFIAHSDPTQHPSYVESWLSGLVDEVATYDFGFDRMQYIRNMEQVGGRVVEKAAFDYAYLLNKCAEQFTPYVAIFEDDTVAMDGWYHRTMTAIHEAEQQAALRRSKPDFFYLRLFYTEQFLGWNKQFWKSYLWRSIFVAALPSALLVFVRVFKPRTKLSMTLTTPRAFIALYAGLAALILFYFSLGRMTVHPMPYGVHEMPHFGCCSQAFVFPNLKAQQLVAYFKEKRVGFTDVLIEDFANERDELRFVITPSLVQHVGREDVKSSKDRGSAEKIWSAAFEKLNWKTLKVEHEEVGRLRSVIAQEAPP